MKGILGKYALLEGINQAIYVNNYTEAAVVAVNVCNRNWTSSNVSLAVSTSPTSPINAEWIEYECILAGKSAFERSGIVVSPGHYIVLTSSQSNVNAVAWGQELGEQIALPVSISTNAAGVGPTWITPSELTVYAGDTSSLQVSSDLPFTLDTTSRPGYSVYIFKSGTGTWTPPAGVSSVEYLVVGGGGGGGYDAGGGGGAGGVLSGSISLTAGTPYTVIVGPGGRGSTGAQARSGEGSTFATLQARGGGYGGDGINGTGNATGSQGGSGGGGCGDTANTLFLGGAGVTGQGNSGGSGYHSSGVAAGGGGGGGAGAVGANMPGTFPTTNPQAAGNGGVGVTTTIITAAMATTYSVGQVSAGSVYVGGGGGGGINNDAGNTGAAGLGGLGGGGVGSRTTNGTDGTANTGGGGGAGFRVNGNGGAGGSGVVIIAHAS